MMQRELSARRIVGFACNQAFAFILLFSGIAAAIGGTNGALTHVHLLCVLAFMVAGFALMRVLPANIREKAFSRPLLYIYAIVMGAGSLLLLYPPSLLPANLVLVTHGLLSGLPCAVLLVAWGRTFGGIPSASSTPEVFLGSLVAAFFCLAVALVGTDSPAYLISCILPLGSVINIEIPSSTSPEHDSSAAPSQTDCDESRSLSSKVIVGTLFFGVAEGLASTAASETAASLVSPVVLSMILFGAFLLGALSLLLSDGFGRGDALNKSYRLALFVMLVGVLIAPWPAPATSALPGETLVLAGYLGLETVLISLFLELTNITGDDATIAFSSGFSALFAGVAVGIVLGDVIALAAPFVTTSLTGVVILVSYLFLFTERDFDELSRIVTKTDQFEVSCARIVETYGLSKRESEILAFALRGRTSERIASELVISKSTVDTHLRRIYAKCGVHSRQELIDLAELQ